MPARASKPKMPRDPSQLAAAIVRMATGHSPKPQPDTRNPAAVALSKLGASKGGKARAKALTKRQRSEIAKQAAKTRWNVRKIKPHKDQSSSAHE